MIICFFFHYLLLLFLSFLNQYECIVMVYFIVKLYKIFLILRILISNDFRYSLIIIDTVILFYFFFSYISDECANRLALIFILIIINFKIILIKSKSSHWSFLLYNLSLFFYDLFILFFNYIIRAFIILKIYL